ncbi:MAG: alpha/beta hydrolase [Pseudomonadota bacterium]
MPSPAERVAQTLGSARIHHTSYEGGELYWQRWSASKALDAPPLLLFHGGFGSWNHWIANVEDLRQKRDVWTFDLPGLGQSDDMPEPHTIAHFSEIVLSGIDQLLGDQNPFAIAAFSFGAMIAGQVAADVGERCTRCTLIGAAGFGDLHEQVSLLPPPTLKTSAEEAERIQRENLRRLMLHSPSAIDDLAVYLHSDNLSRFRFRSRGLAKTNELAKLLPSIRAPLTGVWGSEDTTAGGAEQIAARRQLFASANNDSEFFVLNGVGHWAMYEAPAAVNRILLNDL